jgi:hypothetical protein
MTSTIFSIGSTTTDDYYTFDVRSELAWVEQRTIEDEQICLVDKRWMSRSDARNLWKRLQAKGWKALK